MIYYIDKLKNTSMGFTYCDTFEPEYYSDHFIKRCFTNSKYLLDGSEGEFYASVDDYILWNGSNSNRRLD